MLSRFCMVKLRNPSEAWAQPLEDPLKLLHASLTNAAKEGYDVQRGLCSGAKALLHCHSTPKAQASPKHGGVKSRP